MHLLLLLVLLLLVSAGVCGKPAAVVPIGLCYCCKRAGHPTFLLLLLLFLLH
jgi:hypothetical protein